MMHWHLSVLIHVQTLFASPLASLLYLPQHKGKVKYPFCGCSYASLGVNSVLLPPFICAQRASQYWGLIAAKGF